MLLVALTTYGIVTGGLAVFFWRRLQLTGEAYLGNRAWQLCQPVRSLWQCVIKFATGLGVGFVVGLLIPVVVAVVYASVRTGEMVGPGFEPGAVSRSVTLHFMLFGVAAWCATWSRSSLTTMVKAFLVVVSFIVVTTHLALEVDVQLFYLLGHQSGGYNYSPPDWRITAGMLAVLATAATLLNFRFTDVPARRWLGKGGAFAVVVFVLALTILRLS